MPPKFKLPSIELPLSMRQEVESLFAKLGRVTREDRPKLNPLTHAATTDTLTEFMRQHGLSETDPLMRQPTRPEVVSQLDDIIGQGIEGGLQGRNLQHAGILDKLETLSTRIPEDEWAATAASFFEPTEIHTQEGLVRPKKITPQVVSSALDQALGLAEPDKLGRDVGSTLDKGTAASIMGRKADEIMSWLHEKGIQTPEDVTADATVQQAAKPGASPTGGRLTRAERKALRATYEAQQNLGGIESQSGGVGGVIPLGSEERNPMTELESGRRIGHLLPLMEENTEGRMVMMPNGKMQRVMVDRMVEDRNGNLVPLREAIKDPEFELNFEEINREGTKTGNVLNYPTGGRHRIIKRPGFYEEKPPPNTFYADPRRKADEAGLKDIIPRQEGKTKDVPSERWYLHQADQLGMTTTQLKELLVNADPEAFAIVYGKGKRRPPKSTSMKAGTETIGKTKMPNGWTLERALYVLEHQHDVGPDEAKIYSPGEIKTAKYVAQLDRLQNRRTSGNFELLEPHLADIVTGSSKGMKPLISTVGSQTEAVPLSALPVTGPRPPGVAAIQSPGRAVKEVEITPGTRRNVKVVTLKDGRTIELPNYPDIPLDRLGIEQHYPGLWQHVDSGSLEIGQPGSGQAAAPVHGRISAGGERYPSAQRKTEIEDPIKTEQILTLQREGKQVKAPSLAELRKRALEQYPELANDPKALNKLIGTLASQADDTKTTGLHKLDLAEQQARLTEEGQQPQPGSAVRQLYPSMDPTVENNVFQLHKAGWQILPPRELIPLEGQEGVWIVAFHPKDGTMMVTSPQAGKLQVVPMADLGDKAPKPKGLHIMTGLVDYNRGQRNAGLETSANDLAKTFGFQTHLGRALENDALAAKQRKVDSLPQKDTEWVFPDPMTGRWKPLKGAMQRWRDLLNVAESDGSLFLTNLTRGNRDETIAPRYLEVQGKRTKNLETGEWGAEVKKFGGDVQNAWEEASRHRKPSLVLNIWPDEPLDTPAKREAHFQFVMQKAQDAAKWVLVNGIERLNIKGITAAGLAHTEHAPGQNLRIGEAFLKQFYSVLRGGGREGVPVQPLKRGLRAPEAEHFPDLGPAAGKSVPFTAEQLAGGQQSGQLRPGDRRFRRTEPESPAALQSVMNRGIETKQKINLIEDELMGLPDPNLIADRTIADQVHARWRELNEKLERLQADQAALEESGLHTLVPEEVTDKELPPRAQVEAEQAARVGGEQVRIPGAKPAAMPPEASAPMATPEEKLFGMRGINERIEAIRAAADLSPDQEQHRNELERMLEMAAEVHRRDPQRFVEAGWPERVRALLGKAGPTVMAALMATSGLAKWWFGQEEATDGTASASRFDIGPKPEELATAGVGRINLGPIATMMKEVLFGAGHEKAPQVGGKLGELAQRRAAPTRIVEPIEPTLMGKLKEKLIDSTSELKKPSERFEAAGGLIPDEDNPNVMLPVALGGSQGPAHLAGERMRPLMDKIRELDLIPEFTAILDADSIGRADELSSRGAIEKGREAARLRLLGRNREAAALEQELAIINRNLAEQTTGPMGIPPEVAQAQVAEIKARLTPDELGLIEQAKSVMHAENQKLIEDAYNNGEGIISEDLRNNLLQRGFYTPLHYIQGEYKPETDEFLRARLSRMQDAQMKKAGNGALSVTEQGLIKELMGAGDAQAANRDPFEAWQKYLETGYHEIGRNKAARSIVRQGDHIPGLMRTPENPEGHIIPLTRDEVAPAGYSPISYLKEGVDQRYAIPVSWGDALQVANEQAVAPGLRTLGNIQKLMQMSATSANLAFLPRNVAKDFQDTAMLLPGMTAGDLPTYAKLWNKHLWQVLNGEVSDVRSEGTRVGLDLAGMAKQMDPTEFARGNPRLKSINPLSKVIGASQVALNATEQASKLASYEFLRNLDGTLHKGASMSPLKAAATARKLGGSPDFAIKGTYAGPVSKFISFFNPQIQGTVRTIEHIRKNPKKMLGLMAGMTTGFAALDQYNRTFKVQQPDGTMIDAMQDVPESDLQNNIVIMLPQPPQLGRDGRMHQPYTRIPLGHAAKLLFVPIQDTFRALHGDPSVSLLETATGSIGSILPGNLKIKPDDPIRSIALSSVSGLNPALKVPIEQMLDRNSFTDTPIVGSRLEKVRPYSLQYNTQTSPSAKTVGDWVGKLPGVSQTWLASPERLEAAYRSIVPGAGEMLLSGTDAIARLKDQQPRESVMTTPEWLSGLPGVGPILRPMIGRSGSQTRDDMNEPVYAAADEAQKRISGVQHLLKMGDREGATVLARQPETAWAIQANATLQRITKELGEIAAQKDIVRKSGRPPAEIAQKLQQLAREEQLRLLTGLKVVQAHP